MPRIAVETGFELQCDVDDHLWPWDRSTPVLMLHGYARSARFWDRWIPAVSETRRVYRPELRGCGRSEVPPTGYQFEPHAMIEDLLRVMDELELEKVHWVGELSGGLLGIMLSLLHPERIASIVSCGSPLRITDETKNLFALDESSAAEAIRKLGTEAWCRATLHSRFDVENASPELQDWYVREMGKTPSHVAAGLLACFSTVDLAPVLKDIDVPILLFGGAKKKPIAEMQRRFEREAPNARLRLFDDYGPGVNLLLPELCARESIAFWEQLEAG